jgi:uncharacterized protein
MLKKELRVIGIDDGPFKKSSNARVLVVGTIFRGGLFMDGILSTKVKIDGKNATKKIIEMINGCKFKQQLQCIFLDGIAVAGFNVIDIKQLNKSTKIPVIVIIRRKPNFQKISKTLCKIGKKEKIRILEKAGPVYSINKIYIQISGISIKNAEEFLKVTCTRSLIPEPIRIAHLIASGITDGQTRGKA